ncbi:MULTISPECIES: DUF6438 domain-containing protein [unclassified Sphingomonas]|jgi:hypothetical protein|uniref:DUF6438 domain-containing protein n=1 Tax=unclassified Sphingomonas TaxID=196159 RepID=UPI0025E3DC06|nr:MULTISPECIES: DUF6438 domain-containing protein [unclassified Sphingomonas]
MRKGVIAGLGVVLAGAAVSGCVVVDASNAGNNGRPVALESETIRYETAPCFGTCPVYAVTIAPNGKGTFEGKRFTAVTGIKPFQATPAAYHSFAAKLAPYRPSQPEALLQPGQPGCENAPTDMPSVDIVWSEASGSRQHLNVYYGCGSQEMRAGLRSAPEALPIAAFIGDPRRPR